MAALSFTQQAQLTALIGAAPDAVVEAVATMPGPVAALAEAELAERAAARLAFAPLLPSPSPYWAVTPATVRRLWRAVAAAEPELASAALQAAARASLEDADAELLDGLCRATAALIRREPSAFAGLQPAAETLTVALELAPVLRRALARLPDWLGRSSSEATALARLAYRDACKAGPEAGPLFVEILYAHLDEPWLILSAMSAVMGRPSDRFVAVSELGRFGERVLDDAAARVGAVQGFDAVDGSPAGAEAARQAQRATVRLEQFELAFDLARDGPWGGRVLALRRALAAAVEVRMADAAAAVGAALPVQRAQRRGAVGTPRLDRPLEPLATARARTLVAFLAEIATAMDGGWSAARTRTVAGLTERLAQYLDDVVGRIHAHEGDETAAREHLDLAAELYGALADPRTATAARRRAAAA